MTSSKYYPYLLVTFQMGSLLYIAFSASVVSDSVAGLFVEASGIFLAIHAIYIVKIRNVNITPTVKANSELVTSGPYRIIRHPMYIAQLIAVLPLIVEYFSYTRLLVFFMLLITLLVKIQFEERQLVTHFPEYKTYQKTTYKLIPYIY